MDAAKRVAIIGENAPRTQAIIFFAFFFFFFITTFFFDNTTFAIYQKVSSTGVATMRS